MTLSSFAQSAICDYYSPQCDSKYKTYVDSVKIINGLVEEHLISPRSGRKEVLKLAQSMFPQDSLLISIAEQQYALVNILEQSQLTVQQKDKLEKAAESTYSNALAERFAMLQAAKEIGDERSAARQQAKSASQVVYVDEGYATNNAIPTALFLNKIGQAFSNSYNQYLIPMTTCNSWGKGTVTCY